MQYKKSLLLAAVLTGLSACGGEEGNAAGIACKSLAPLVDGANASNNCAAGGCSVSNAAGAADGNSGSAATLLQSGATSGYVAVDAKASGGGTFAAGTVVGVVWEASSATRNGVTFAINTYLAGVEQDSFSLGSDGVGSPTRPITFASQTTTRPYDTVEFRYTRASGATTGSAKVYEFCSG